MKKTNTARSLATSFLRTPLSLLLLSAATLHGETPASQVWGTKEGAAKSKSGLTGTDANRPGKPGETGKQRDERLGWWRDARFGMFVHWGLYSQAGGEWAGKKVTQGGAEWIQSVKKIPGAQYVRLAKDFNPTGFDARAWVKAAKDAGMKYIVVTAKHHDGFAMWPTKAGDYDITDRTAFKRDPIRELADACKAEGLRLGLYYSQNLDWNDPYARGNEWEFTRAGADFPRYMKEKALPQLRELLTNYGPIAELWWDFPLFATQAEGDTFRNLVWQLQPGIIQNDRAGGAGGDFSTPEQTMPGETANSDFESCMTMNETWGYRGYDHEWKSSAELIRNLTNTASKGGNFLINVGPDGLGRIPSESLRLMKDVGDWLKVNGDSIYGCDKTPVGTMPWGRVTAKPGKLFLQVMDWPADGTITLPVTNKIISARLLARPDEPLAIRPGAGFTVIQGPKIAPDANVTVIELAIEGEPVAGNFEGQRLINPGFELAGGRESWSGAHCKTVDRALAGKQSVRMSLSMWSPNTKSEEIRQTVRINPGSTLVFSGIAKPEVCDRATAFFEVEVNGADGKRLMVKTTGSVTGAGEAVILKLDPFEAPEGAASATVRCLLRRKDAERLPHDQAALFDDVTLTATPRK